MVSLNIVSNSAERTRMVGVKLGGLAAAGDVILLIGALGAGKTCLTQGIARGLGVDDYVVSPSFVLLREYQGRLPLYHVDFYRLEGIEEMAHLGLDDYLYGDGLCVVEWADKGLDMLPSEHLLIEMHYLAPSKRDLSFLPRGSRYEEMVSQLKSARQVARK